MSATLTLPKHVAELGAVCEAHGRYALAGINFEIDDLGKVKACVTDGKILVELDLGTATDLGGAMSVILDPKALKLALAACHSKARDPSIRFELDGATVVGNGAKMRVPCIEGTFPRYEDVIPSETSSVETTNFSIEFDAKLISKVVNVLFKACGGKPKSSDGRCSFAFHGPKEPTRIDYRMLDIEGRAVIMPLAPQKK